MNIMKWFSSIVLLLCIGCVSETKKTGPPLQTVLASENPALKKVLERAEQYEVQILFTQVIREGDSVRLEEESFRLDPDHYFYPASTVKLPTAVLALEKLSRTDSLNLQSRYFIEGDTIESSFEQDIRAIFAISDNEAHNRLIDFLGFDSINQGFRRTGDIRMSQRLGGYPLDPVSRRMIFQQTDSSLVTTRALASSPFRPLELGGLEKGKGYYEDGELVQEPFDFSLKNYFPLSSQHRLMQQLILPELYPMDARYHLGEKHREFLLNALRSTPRKAGLDPETYPDGYGKFFIYGDSRETIPEHISIYNKAGWAYGTLTDNAYIRDDQNDLEFFVSATILVNEDGIFNDDRYEYQETGIPFLATLGRELHQHLIRNKNHGNTRP